MKFSTSPLALLAVLLAFSSMSFAVKTVEELDNEMRDLVCPPGKTAAKVGQFCPRGAKDPRDCQPTRVECVQKWFGNDPINLVRMRKNPETTLTSKTEEELDYEMQHMQCPFGEKPAKVIPLCPKGAKSPGDCMPITVKCVKLSFSNDWGDRTNSNVPTSSLAPQQTEEELDREMAHMECPFTQRPAKVLKTCPSGAKDVADCWRIVVKCLRSHFGNTWRGRQQGILTSMPSSKTEEELSKEMAHAECPFGQRPAKISPLCPSDAKSNLDCPPVEVACVQQTFGNNPGSREPPGRGPTAGSPPLNSRLAPKTEKELDLEMMNKKCIFGQRPARISPWCPTGAKDRLDCAHTEVWCVKDSYINNPVPVDSVSSITATPPETVDQLEADMAHMICPVNHQPSLIKGICPTSSKSSTGCTMSYIACRPQTMVNKPISDRHDMGARRRPHIDIVDKIMRGQSSEGKWSERVDIINKIFHSQS